MPETAAVSNAPNDPDPSVTWPAVEAAYAFVLPSYQMLCSRFESADSRLSSLLTMSSSLTIAAPIFARAVNPQVSFGSFWFALAATLFLISVLIGLVGRIAGSLTLPNPRIHYEQSLHRSAWEFKKNAIYFAGRHFDANVRAIRWKGNVSIALIVLLVSEVSALVAWISGLTIR